MYEMKINVIHANLHTNTNTHSHRPHYINHDIDVHMFCGSHTKWIGTCEVFRFQDFFNVRKRVGDSTRGSSGGPWVTEGGKLAGLNSYTLAGRPDVMYG